MAVSPKELALRNVRRSVAAIQKHTYGPGDEDLAAAMYEAHTLMFWLMAADPEGKALALAQAALAQAMVPPETEPGG